MLAKRGYHVVASTGKASEHEYLRAIGAADILSREDFSIDPIPVLGKQRWAAAIDPVGGKALASILIMLQYGGSVAVSGLTGGGDVPTTVYPFILRGVNLLGIDSVYCPMELRKTLWERMATDLKPEALLNYIAQEVTLDELPQVLSSILKAEMRGRTIVKL
jgi:putative YhdH/YhfP family quinone oxidoreductase